MGAESIHVAGARDYQLFQPGFWVDRGKGDVVETLFGQVDEFLVLEDGGVQCADMGR